MQHAKQARELAEQMRAGCLGVRVGRLQRLVNRRFEASLRTLGLSISQMEVLSALVVYGQPVRPSELAEWLAIERSTMSRNLALMESRGLLETTERSPAGRTMAVDITRTGVAALASASEGWADAQSEVLRQLGDDAAATLDTWLTAMTANHAAPSHEA